VKPVHIFLALFLLVVIVFFSSPALQFLALLYLAVLALSFLYSRLASRYVVVRRKEMVSRAHRLEPMEITLVVENRSPLPIQSLSLVDLPNNFFASGPGQFLLALGPWGKRTLSYRLISQNRGEYTLGPAVLRGSDPLGFFPWKKQYGEVQTLIVYPEVAPIVLPVRSGLPAGSIQVESRIYEDVTRYRSLREYVPGDDFRRICWKVSARTGRLYSVDYLQTLYAPVLILLSLKAEDYPARYRYHWVERAAVLAASLVVHFLKLKQEVGFLACASFKNGGGIPAAEIRGTHGHGMTILEMLARMEATAENMDFSRLLADSGLDIPFQTRLQVITPRLSSAEWALLRGLKRRGCTVELYLIGAGNPRQPEISNREFPVYTVSDYGHELFRR
jgi:uncharacterized protein (DUF58 family)